MQNNAHRQTPCNFIFSNQRGTHLCTKTQPRPVVASKCHKVILPRRSTQNSNRNMGLLFSKNGGAAAETDSAVVLLPSNNSATAIAARDKQKGDAASHLRHKKARLLLLHHAAKCQHDVATTGGPPCPVTPHCKAMKDLWKHMDHGGCHSKSCGVPHCYSSRYILTHYKRCQDAQCLICGPVRERVRRAKEMFIKDASSSVDAVDGRGNSRRQKNATISASSDTVNTPFRSSSLKRSRAEQDFQKVQKRQCRTKNA